MLYQKVFTHHIFNVASVQKFQNKISEKTVFMFDNMFYFNDGFTPVYA